MIDRQAGRQRQSKNALKKLLDAKVDEYNQPFFISEDPVCIPHMFSKRHDREIAGFFAAIFAWGNRTTIINKSKELMTRFGNEPYAFCTQRGERHLKALEGFKHRTFNDSDLLAFVSFFKQHYKEYDSLESAFTLHGKTVKEMLSGFHHYFFSLTESLPRTRKHISTPEKNSTCKRLNMFLRWMVRNDGKVDFGIWKEMSPAQLICPIDVHVARVARKMKLITRKQTDWQAAEELTEALRRFDNEDPVKYDFALFDLGVRERF